MLQPAELEDELAGPVDKPEDEPAEIDDEPAGCVDEPELEDEPAEPEGKPAGPVDEPELEDEHAEPKDKPVDLWLSRKTRIRRRRTSQQTSLSKRTSRNRKKSLR